MRADRLVAILLLLQTRDRVTASEIALELEISERTARRDLDALGVAGLPIYSRPGRNGGWQLLGGGRTDLSGLTSAEARALFLVAGPASATPEVRAALRKLVRALPEPFRPAAEAASNAVVIDHREWGGRERPRRAVVHLEGLQKAVVEGEQVRLGYVSRDRTASTRVVHPLGLAAKSGSWYLVADTETGLRTFRVDRVVAVEPTGEAVVRPDGFDLEAAWRSMLDALESVRVPITARGLVLPDAVWLCRSIFGERVQIGPPGPDGRIDISFRGHAVESLAGELAGLGARVEILEPAAVRDALHEIGAGLMARYASVSGDREER